MARQAVHGAARRAVPRERIGIAGDRAEPELLVTDEPVSALDVSVQASILKRLQQDLALTVRLVRHDLAVVRQLCDRVIVLHDGKIAAEGGAVRDLFAAPRGPVRAGAACGNPDLLSLAVGLPVTGP
ncbi:ABC transporter ATP-binding protein [Candidatus Solirubrobacter pratensis]|uniref:ABC transporter ATP-binding protein n=1 Tax=Candidatus Solirubrobacter pratensis TaxID=1298857 RepID=UPI0004268942|nr:ABC transporter ATP-binding protein [Candidatus Solirubrobacter pratensis]